MELFRRMFNEDKGGQDPTRLTLARAQQVVDDYEDFLKTSATSPGQVSDAKTLPHSKETIKAAITASIYLTRDPVRTEQLRYCYIMLSTWQEGVGDETLGIDFTQLDLTVEPGKLNDLIQELSASMEKWSPIVEAEQKQLRAELKAMGAYRSRHLI